MHMYGRRRDSNSPAILSPQPHGWQNAAHLLSLLSHQILPFGAHAILWQLAVPAHRKQEVMLELLVHPQLLYSNTAPSNKPRRGLFLIAVAFRGRHSKSWNCQLASTGQWYEEKSDYSGALKIHCCNVTLLLNILSNRVTTLQ